MTKQEKYLKGAIERANKTNDPIASLKAEVQAFKNDIRDYKQAIKNNTIKSKEQEQNIKGLQKHIANLNEYIKVFEAQITKMKEGK